MAKKQLIFIFIALNCWLADGRAMEAGACESFLSVARLNAGLSLDEIRDLATGLRGMEGLNPSQTIVGVILQSLVKENPAVWHEAIERLAREDQAAFQLRSQVQTATTIANTKMQFELLAPLESTFPPKDRRTRYFEPFHLMRTPVTRWMWHQVMQKGPARDVSFVPDEFPVVRFSRAELREFLKMFNDNVDHRSDWQAWVVDHRPGDRYHNPNPNHVRWLNHLLSLHYGYIFTHGERLRVEGLVSALGRHMDVGVLARRDPSDPVGSRGPFVLGGAELYDLFGYVSMTVDITAEGDEPNEWLARWGTSNGEEIAKYLPTVDLSSGRRQEPEAFSLLPIRSDPMLTRFLSLRLVRSPSRQGPIDVE